MTNIVSHNPYTSESIDTNLMPGHKTVLVSRPMFDYRFVDKKGCELYLPGRKHEPIPCDAQDCQKHPDFMSHVRIPAG